MIRFNIYHLLIFVCICVFQFTYSLQLKICVSWNNTERNKHLIVTFQSRAECVAVSRHNGTILLFLHLLKQCHLLLGCAKYFGCLWIQTWWILLQKQSLSSPTPEATKFSSFKMKSTRSECCSNQHLRGRRKVTHEWNQALTTLQITKSHCKSCTADLTCGNKRERKRVRMLETAMCLPVS